MVEDRLALRPPPPPGTFTILVSNDFVDSCLIFLFLFLEEGRRARPLTIRIWTSWWGNDWKWTSDAKCSEGEVVDHCNTYNGQCEAITQMNPSH